MKWLSRLPLLAKILIAIVFGHMCSFIFPDWATRLFVTFNSIFSNYLGFIIPLLIVGLVAPGIAELGSGATRLLGITCALAYGSTLFSGFMTYFACIRTYPSLLKNHIGSLLPENLTNINEIAPYFTIEMPPMMGVMTALILAFVLGLGLSAVNGKNSTNILKEFRDVITLIITKTIIPLLPFYIFGIFLKMGNEGYVNTVLGTFFKVIIVIIVLHILLLLIQFLIAGAIARKNPFKALLTMLPAYVTALGTQSSAATIPVTLAQTKKNGVDEQLAAFTVPLCATIHLAGSTLKIVACAIAISMMTGMPVGLDVYAGFIFLLGITMIAAPGVPGGAIMAALALLSSSLNFDATMQGLMIAIYIALDSFGTAANVTGDGAIALIVDRIYKK